MRARDLRGAERAGSAGLPGCRRRIAVTSAMSRGQRAGYAMLAGAWLLMSGYFWAWWVLPGHAGNPALFAVVSAALFYNVTVLPAFYLFYLGQMRRPVPVDVRDAEAAGIVGRVAVISLTVPGSESLDIARRQLAAMTEIRYPHDSWILVDKEHSPEIAQLARRMGVLYFCRHDVSSWGTDRTARWNAPDPPFQARTKAGNVNSWLDQVGDCYTHFAQFDIDHHPVASYLERVLGFFVDPKVAWVQAPSVYGNHEHWTARGSSEQEVVLQGPLQMGFFGFCRTPFIIGSHCTYDMKAYAAAAAFSRLARRITSTLSASRQRAAREFTCPRSSRPVTGPRHSVLTLPSSSPGPSR
jgi:cellulose synthase (UDP-forming)